MNAFALLAFDACPWLEPDVVQEQAAASIASNAARPELVREFSEARKILVEPRLRLRHLLDLTCPGEKLAGGPTTIPNVLAEWFEEATKLEEKLNAFFARKDAATSPLTRAMLAREAMSLREEAETWLVRLALHEDEWLKALREFDARWREDGPAARSSEVLAVFVQAFAYLGRWRDAVRDRAFALLAA